MLISNPPSDSRYFLPFSGDVRSNVLPESAKDSLDLVVPVGGHAVAGRQGANRAGLSGMVITIPTVPIATNDAEIV